MQHDDVIYLVVFVAADGREVIFAVGQFFD